ncbi:MAG TPA: ester cyclase [Candidatus Dormibacteraeota bacterium]
MTADLGAVVRRAWAAYDAGDEQGFRACVTDDWREFDFGDPEGESAGVDEILGSMAAQSAAFPDKQTEVLFEVVEGDVVAQYTISRATHLGRYFDLEPTGERVTATEMCFHQMRGGLIARTWAATAEAGFYTQLTGRPPPEKLDNQT